ncbi:hypothetical protein QAD02_009164 [Eretmocerus hayati]|uniref:Uncharacterized protein n=1 Tax=Eretmocerus hayati TaxID=131215 RepID=A0ACC2N9C0_9HYME|nr:hypothetical protein QAD02_009164 [Eretmocerus hayati]
MKDGFQGFPTVEEKLETGFKIQAWGNTRTSSSQYTCCKVMYMALALLSVILSTVALPTEETEETNLICETPQCQSAATTILGNLDLTVQPCDDFYQFACGNYKKGLELPGDSPYYTPIYNYSNEARRKLRIGVEEPITEEDPEAFEKLQKFYNVCMNESHINENSENEFLQILYDLGGWPVLVGESWDGSNFDWKRFILEIDSMGFKINQFLSMYVNIDAKNTSGTLIEMSAPSFGIDQGYLLKSPSGNTSNKIENAYFKYMVGVAKLLGANSPDIEGELKDSLEFEKNLANISLLMRVERDLYKRYNPTTVAEMDEKHSYVQWSEFLQRLMSPTVQLSPSNKINLHDENYFTKFPEVLAKFSKRTIANYAFWRLVQDSVPYLSTRLNYLATKLTSELYGISTISSRWKTCISAMKRGLPIASGALYVRRNFDPRSKNDAKDLFHRVKEAFKESLEQADWMDSETRMAAMTKLDNMTSVIAYPDEYLDDGKLDAFYGKIRIDPSSYLRTSLSLNFAERRRWYEYLTKEVDNTDWTKLYDTAADINGYMDLNGNAIDIKAGILQGMMFNTEYPKYINYGGIGVIMGHEISHGFDDQGKMKDEHGNLRNWWKTDTEEKFQDKAHCVIDQYSNYSVTIDGTLIHLNGQQTLGENIADIGGVKSAYLAYKNWQREFGDEPRLPGLDNFTSEQMFWISFANTWCVKYRPEYLKDTIETDPHTYEPYRVIGVASNRPEFSRDFNCPDHSPMNPDKKCNVW